ncbi:MAG: putative metal-binding motif-containing protein [Pseudomonadota bacterium]|nr:putative metal-binding motif-containing protein [Pseudomonadota bacterium]
MLRPSHLLLVLLAAACTAPSGEDKDPVDPGPDDSGDMDPPVDADGDGFEAAYDCDDSDATVNPDATEMCDGVDNNCDAHVDESTAADALTWYGDTDGDGAGDAEDIVSACTQPANYLTTATDCDDANPSNFPGNLEVCDGADNDCDATVDEDDAADAPLWYADEDGDGYGDAEVGAPSCAAPAGHVADATDCDDADATAYVGAPESCDGVDHDCDGAVHEDSSVDVSTWYADADGDGHGSVDFTTETCLVPDGFVSTSSDCDDDDATTYVGAPESCDGVDHDCDGAVYEDSSVDTSTWYADSDGDGYGTAGSTTEACLAPAGFVASTSDCDDLDATSSPAGTEVCDGADNDCDRTVDEGAADVGTWYADTDGDGYGDASASTLACDRPSGHVADATDCDDGDPTRTTSCDALFSGTFGTRWETRATTLTAPYSLQSFHPSGTLLHNMYDAIGQAYDPDSDVWTELATTAPASRIWNSMAPYDGQLWSIMNNTIYRYTPSTDGWDTITTITGGDDYNMTESDEVGNIYGHTSDGNIVVYDTETGTVDYVPTGLGSQYETRLGYDPTGPALYFGAFHMPALYRYDLVSGEITQVADIPESQLNDIFCSDRSGHIYAAGDTGGKTMWQYTTATDTWASLPDLPTDHGNNSTCTVSEDGWLYVGTDNSEFYRLALY